MNLAASSNFTFSTLQEKKINICSTDGLEVIHKALKNSLSAIKKTISHNI